MSERSERTISRNLRLFLLAGLLVGVGLALFVSPFASSQPDGLEKVAAEEGFGDAAENHDVADGPLADYGVEGVDDARVGTAMAGLIGMLVTFGVGLALFAVARALRGRPRATPQASST
jgi:cobalt/nickel transport system permease protein